MIVVGVIPIRAGSTRFPGKGLAKLNGKPVALHVYERSRQYARFKRLIVATDDINIRDLIEAEGGEVFFSTKEYRNGSERVADSVLSINCDICVNIQGDEIFITPQIIEKTISALINDDLAVVSTAVFPIPNALELADRNLVKAVLDDKNRAVAFSREEIKGAASMKLVNWGHAGIYAFRRKFLMEFVVLPQTKGEVTESLEQLRILESGYKIGAVCLERPIVSVNTPEDLLIASKVLMDEGGT